MNVKDAQEYLKKKAENDERDKQVKLMQEQVLQYLQQSVNGGPSSLRIIAKIEGSNYDITITKQEELDMVQMLINKFINTFEIKYPRPNKLF